MLYLLDPTSYFPGLRLELAWLWAREKVSRRLLILPVKMAVIYYNVPSNMPISWMVCAC